MIEEALSWAEVESAQSVLDVGCGVGGSSRYLQRKYGAKVTGEEMSSHVFSKTLRLSSFSFGAGITLSPKQRDQAAELSKKTGQEDCNFQVADALQCLAGDDRSNELRMPFPDNSFDLIWSLESGEHMPRKEMSFDA